MEKIFNGKNFIEKKFKIKNNSRDNKLLQKEILKMSFNNQKMKFIKKLFLKVGIISVLSNIIILLLINLILIRKINAIQIIKLVANGDNYKIINAGKLPDRVYLNGNLAEMDSSYRVKSIEKGKLNNITLEWDSKSNQYERLFKNLDNIIEIDFTNFDFSGATSFKEIFTQDKNLKYINFGNADTSSITRMSSMFEGCSSLTSLDLSSFNTILVTQMVKMFKDCEELISLNLSNFNTPKLKKMNHFLYGCAKLKYIDLTSFTTDSVTELDSIFYNCFLLTSINIINFNTKSAVNMEQMFKGCESLKEIDLSNMDTSNVKNMKDMFSECVSLISLDLSNFITSKVENMENMFSNCNSITSLDISNFDLSNVKSIKNLFGNCWSLLSLDLSSFDISRKDVESMFFNCYSLTSIIFSNKQILWGNITFMFFNCSSLKSLDFSYFDFEEVQDASFLFYNCSSLKELDMSDINASFVENMNFMFSSCKSLKSINFSNFLTSSVKTFYCMFSDCESLISLDLSSFDTSFVIDMEKMFFNCTELVSVNLTSFNTFEVDTMNSMFFNCHNLKSLDLSSFIVKPNTNFENMFNNCSNLKYIDFYNFREESETNTNMIYKTSKYLIVCMGETPTSLLSQFNDKRCIIDDCSIEINDDRSIIYDNKHCINDCLFDEKFKYKYKDYCYDNCPKGTEFKKDNIYVCEKKIYNCLESYPFIIKEENTCTEECSCIDFFNDICTINTINIESQALLFNNIIKGIQEGLINELIDEALSKGKDLFRIENNAIYRVSDLKNNQYHNYSFININECEDILIEKYNLSEEDQMFIYKTELYTNELLIPIIDYKIFDFKTKTLLNLNYCKENNIKINIEIPISINENILYKYIPFSDYYTDICSYNNENEDITLYDRKSNFNNNNLSICPKNCIYKEYNNTCKIVNCECQIKDKGFLLYINNTDELIYKFKIKKKPTNFEILKCYKTLFSKNGLIKNSANYLILLVIIFYIISAIYFYIKGFDIICNQVNEIINNKYFEEENKTDLNTTGYSKNATSKNCLESKNSLNKNIVNNKMNGNQKNKSNEKTKTYIDYEMNIIPYKEALENDKRTYFQFYISLIKDKNIIISIFNKNIDYNSHIVKICLFLFSFILNLVINTLFFNEYKMHIKYINRGKYIFKDNITSIIYSIIIFSIIFLLIKRASLTQKNILEIKHEENKYIFKGKILIVLRCIIIKSISFFIFGIIILLLFWYYLSSFCAVFKNTQSYLFINALISYGFYLVLPFFICLLPGIFRIPSLREPEKCLYKLSQIIQII